MEVNHSERGSSEISTEMAVGSISVGNYDFRRSLLVADCRYEVLLGMP